MMANVSYILGAPAKVCIFLKDLSILNAVAIYYRTLCFIHSCAKLLNERSGGK